MKVTVLGGCGAWPEPDVACSGYLVAAGTAQVLIDPGYGTFQQLLRYVAPSAIDAVLVSHEHPDHCADLNPLLRARKLGGHARPLPVYAPPGAVDAVIAIDEPDIMDGAYELHEFGIGDSFEIGPLQVQTRQLPHFVPNAGIRVSDGHHAITYTGDAGPSEALPELAEGSDLLIAEATYVDGVLPKHVGNLSDARSVARQARLAGAQRLMLTHLWPGTNPTDSLRVAREEYDGPVHVARPGRVVVLGR